MKPSVQKIINKLPKEKVDLATQKVDLALLDDIKKIGVNLEQEWKEALRLAVNGSKELTLRLNQKIKPINQQIINLRNSIELSEKMLNDLGIGKNSDISQSKSILKIASGQRDELERIIRELNNIY